MREVEGERREEEVCRRGLAYDRVLYDSILGPLVIECKGDELLALRLAKADDVVFTGATSVSDEVFRQVDQYLVGARRFFSLKTFASGTTFQKRVWAAACSIPYGETRTYAQVAEMVGCAHGARAVGMALGRNPIMIVVPCHRVVGASGDLTGYAMGVDVKKRLIELERDNVRTNLCGLRGERFYLKQSF